MLRVAGHHEIGKFTKNAGRRIPELLQHSGIVIPRELIEEMADVSCIRTRGAAHRLRLRDQGLRAWMPGIRNGLELLQGLLRLPGLKPGLAEEIPRILQMRIDAERALKFRNCRRKLTGMQQGFAKA